MATFAQGNGIYFSIGNLTHNLPGSFYHNGVEYQFQCETKLIKNSSGITSTIVFVDNVDDLDFESVPIGAAGILNATVSLPTFGLKVTISGGPAASLATATWMVFPPLGLTFSNDNEAKFKCKLKRFEGVTPA
jgi:hypothetical protein